ncbi:MAG: AMP-binding protein, partial [Acidobacteria bacterium]|nr:AMP-binding protein [Acidobacteriota bacterium]
HQVKCSVDGSTFTRDQAAEIIFTSGTTADPTGVVLTHGNILANLEPLEREIAKYRRYEKLVHPIRFLNLLPLSHVFGQFLGMFIPPLIGGTVIFQDTLNPGEIIRTIRRERISVLVAVPRLLESLREKIERDLEAAGQMESFRREFAAAEGVRFIRRMWRFRRIHRMFGWKFWALISGGAALDSATETFWNRLGFAVVQGYGMTETTSLVSVNHPFKVGRGSIGKVLAGREIKLDEGGEILVRGESVAAAYWQGDVQKPAASSDGWLHTGDLGALDEAGNLYFKGRKKNVIVTREGMNVHPGDLEAALRMQTEVRDCVVVGLSTEEPCAALLLRDHSADAAEIVRRANSTLAEFQHIRRWFIWPEEDFPRTGTQKPKTNLIQQAAEQHFANTAAGKADSATSNSELENLISRITGRATGNLQAGASLEQDLNLSSIERVELASALEDRFQMDLDESRFTAATTVGDLEKLLRASSCDTESHHVPYKYPLWAQREPVRWLRLASYYVLVWPYTMVMARPRIRGLENLENLRGPALIVSNHITYLDIGFILPALPARIRHHLATAMGGEVLMSMRHPSAKTNILSRTMQKFSYWLVTALFNVFPLPQKTGFRTSFAFAGDSADRGYSILVFPEGERTNTGIMAPFRAGIGLLAQNLNLPVVPVRIDGLWELKRDKKHFALPGTITVSIGQSLRFAAGTSPDAITRTLESAIAALKHS